MKKTGVIFVLLFLLLTGCSFSTGIDTLITPPKLSRQQEHIYNALTNYAGTNISLKYPKSGDYLSAFIIADIDGDNEDEAIVFYEKTSVSAEDNSLRMNILDCVDKQWQSVYDHAADGNEVEKVIITQLGDSGRINIVVGYSLINQSEKVVSIYHYEDGTLNTTFENNYYSLFDAADLNGDGTKELFIALNQSPSRDSSVQIFHLNENGEYTKSTVVLEEGGYTDYQKVSYGSLEDGTTGIYLDAVIGSGTIVTNVFAVDESNVISLVFSPDSKKQETLRPAAYTCYDADGDGKIEIPVPQLFPGYSEDDGNSISLTKWYQLKNDRLSVKMCGYQSITNGYSFIFPEGWLGNVTANADTSENYITFSRFTGKKPQEEEMLLTLQTISDNDMEKTEKLLEKGYEILHSRGDKLFLIDINKEDEMTSPAEELMFRFRFYD